MTKRSFLKWLKDMCKQEKFINSKFRDLVFKLERLTYNDSEVRIIRKNVLDVWEDEQQRRKDLALRKANKPSFVNPPAQWGSTPGGVQT